MAILCLANDFDDLHERLGKIIVAYDRDLKPITCKDIRADGAMSALLKDALQPNLVQTLENNPAFIHGGPFANIAHGCNSVIATTVGSPNFEIFSICLNKFGIPDFNAFKSSRPKFFGFEFTCNFKALTVATKTTHEGLIPDFLHLIFRNFSAPKSAPNPASVTT